MENQVDEVFDANGNLISSTPVQRDPVMNNVQIAAIRQRIVACSQNQNINANIRDLCTYLVATTQVPPSTPV